MRVFGIPAGWQVIGIRFPDAPEGEYHLRDEGRGRNIAVWDHLITVAPDGDGTLYTDKVAIDAGWRTPLVAAFARNLYTHRQRRWQRLVRNGFDLEG